MPQPLQIHTIVSMPFQENTYIVWQEGRSDCLVIDPGLEPHLILEFLEEAKLQPALILNTHGHADHIGGNEEMKRAFPDVPIVTGVNEVKLLIDARENLSAYFGTPILSPPPERTVKEGDTIEGAGIQLDVLDVPGHSPGHVAFVHRGTPTLVFGGDVLFRGSIGRHDFPHSDGQTLFRSIRDKLFTLPLDAVVYPGHGPVTTIGQEKRYNPFVGEVAQGGGSIRGI
jgi:glyoxylase-like metal-dependent hydrolase (beta-lactamase superfamily II)